MALKPLCGILFNTVVERQYGKIYLNMTRYRAVENNYKNCLILIISLIFVLLTLLNITQWIQLTQ